MQGKFGVTYFFVLIGAFMQGKFGETINSYSWFNVSHLKQLQFVPFLYERRVYGKEIEESMQCKEKYVCSTSASFHLTSLLI